MNRTSTSADRRAENVRIGAVIITEPEFGDIERQILFNDLVEGANTAALISDQKPSIVLVWIASMTYSPLPNDFVAKVNDRMQVLLTKQQFAPWEWNI